MISLSNSKFLLKTKSAIVLKPYDLTIKENILIILFKIICETTAYDIKL